MLHILAAAILFCSINSFCSDKQIVIITASYNNQMWIPRYFDSIIKQTYTNWILVYIDDFSSDSTLEDLQKLVSEHNLNDRVTIIHNNERHGHLYNQYHAINSLDPNSIVVILDGDDWLYDNDALAVINNAYQNENVWITYGQFWYWKKNKKGFCREIPAETVQKNALREITWRTSHARTFYAGLFQQIRIEDLMYNGDFFPKCADVCTMYPMLEMAGTHYRFIPKVLYMYNDDNPISFHYDPSQQRKLEEYIRAMPRYQPLKERNW